MFSKIVYGIVVAAVLYLVLAGIAWLYLDFTEESPKGIVDIILRLLFLFVALIGIPGMAFWFTEGFRLKTPEVQVYTGYKYPPLPEWQSNDLTYHGSADWNYPAHIYARPDSRQNVKVKNAGSFYLGGGDSGNYVHDVMHAVTIAGSGQGKGVSMILPNLLSSPGCSWFVLDPKGENAKITARFQRSEEQKVIILDPWNEQKRLGATHGIESSGFNPLDFVKGNPDELPESCGVIAAMLVPDQKNVSDPFWNNRARTLIKAYLMHMLTSRPEEEHNFDTLYRWLRLPLENRKALWERMEENEAYDGIIISTISEFLSFGSDSKTLESILSTAHDSTSFLESAPLRKSLRHSDFDPYELTNGRTTVYLCLPERFLITHNRWLRLVVGVCLKACNYKPNLRVNFLLDEFAILGKMQDVENAFAFARGQNICMWVFVQSLTQLIDIYGEHGANAFLANARLRQFFGIYDLATQKYLSEYLGDTTIKLETLNSSYSEGKSEGNSISTNEGSSSGSSGGPNGYSTNSGASSGLSEGKSWGLSRSSSSGRSEQYITRRLVTPEEIGKYQGMITLLDGQKFYWQRIPYWDDIVTAYREDRADYWPLDEQNWRDFIDEMKGKTDDKIGLNFERLGRPDVPQLKAGQKFHL